jgi:hypothetical protein
MWQAVLGFDLPLWLKFIIVFPLVLLLIWAFVYGLKRFGGGALGRSITPRGRQPRLAVIETTSIDGRRQLWLIRRDNVEHLIMTGGPTDLVVEPSIVRAAPTGSAREAAPLREAPPMRETPAIREPAAIRETPSMRDAAPAREIASSRATPSFGDSLPRAVPLADGGNWPLQPEAPPARPARAAPPPPPPAPPAPPPLEAIEPEHGIHDTDWSPPDDPVLEPELPPRKSAFRAEPVARAEPPPVRPEPPIRAEPPPVRAEPPPVRAEPMLRAVPDPEPIARAERPLRVARAQTSDRPSSDRLSGLAADLSRSFMDTDLSAPASASPRPAATEPRRATPPPVQPVESTLPPPLSETEEQNLTEMAQRLESALSRPRSTAAEPAAPAATTVPALRAVELPRIEPIRTETKPRPEPAPAAAAATTKPAAKASPAAAPTAAAKSPFGTLEQEMASLLGRSSSGKT